MTSLELLTLIMVQNRAVPADVMFSAESINITGTLPTAAQIVSKLSRQEKVRNRVCFDEKVKMCCLRLLFFFLLWFDTTNGVESVFESSLQNIRKRSVFCQIENVVRPVVAYFPSSVYISAPRHSG